MPRNPANANLAEQKEPYLESLGERVRQLRGRRGMTRKATAELAGISERHLANLEYGVGNASILVLLHVAKALHCTLAEIVGDVSTSSPEWLMIRALLEGRDEATLYRVRSAIGELIGTTTLKNQNNHRFALIGLRGAGKTSLGKMLAAELNMQFVELSAQIEKLAGCTTAEIQALYGQNAYRRYERRALEEVIQLYPEAIIATPGGLVSDPTTFNELLTQCTTIWLKAKPHDHMQRVLAQGDQRPISASKEAMQDLQSILSSREAFYSKANFQIDTSAQALNETFLLLRETVSNAMRGAHH